MFYKVTIILSVKFLISEIFHVSILSLFYGLSLYKWLILSLGKTRLRDSFHMAEKVMSVRVDPETTEMWVSGLGREHHTHSWNFLNENHKNKQTNEHHQQQQK